MKNFLTYKIDLAFSLIWAVLMILSLITKEYHDALLECLIASCFFQIYFLKQESNPLLKGSMKRMTEHTQRANKNRVMTKEQIDQMIEDIRNGKIVDESEGI